MTNSPTKPMPLEGLKVIDISTMIAGPYCATILGEFGAEVIKVEIPGGGDTNRAFGTPSAAGSSLNWLSEGRNKKSITLDLRKPEGMVLLKRLIEDADVLVENFRPGTLEKWGGGYEELKKINPKLIMVRVTAYGQDGPYRDRPGFARIAHAFSGLAYLAGEPGRIPVVPGSTSLADYVTGVYAALGAMIALIGRSSLGAGQVIDIGLYEGIFRMLDEMPAAYAKSGFVRERMGADTVNVVPHSHYRTLDDRWIAIACTTERMWARLTEAMGRLDLLTNPDFASMGQRLLRRDEVNALVADFTATMPRDPLVELLLKHGVPAGPINSIADIFEDPQFQARKNMIEATDPRIGTMVVHNTVPRLSETPGQLRWLGPDLGAHNTEIFRDRLGLDDVAIDHLRTTGVI
jgi:crotonobetainyl-CoA:carnitine CoA-transferase CaiB-like acyl-CoA transferase